MGNSWHGLFPEHALVSVSTRRTPSFHSVVTVPTAKAPARRWAAEHACKHRCIPLSTQSVQLVKHLNALVDTTMQPCVHACIYTHCAPRQHLNTFLPCAAAHLLFPAACGAQDCWGHPPPTAWGHVCHMSCHTHMSGRTPTCGITPPQLAGVGP